MRVCTPGIVQRRGHRHCTPQLGLESLGKGTDGAIPALWWQDSAILGGAGPVCHTTGLQVQHIAPLPGHGQACRQPSSPGTGWGSWELWLRVGQQHCTRDTWCWGVALPLLKTGTVEIRVEVCGLASSWLPPQCQCRPNPVG